MEKNALLILDNVWNERALFQVMKAIPPTIPVLITSRHAIAVDGEVVEVDTLPPDKALELLAYHARANYTNDTAAKALCEKLGYHPFALEIAGKRIKVEKQMTPARLLENIADAPHMLKVPGSFADIGREGIKDLLDESIHKLSKQQQALFAGMGGLTSSTASVELLAMVVDEAEEKLETAMNDLQQRGLAEIVSKTDDTPTHYHIHDLTHSYARALFRSQRKDYQTATVEAVNRYVEQHGQDFDLLEFEQPNILGAAGAAYQSNNPAALVSIMKTLTLDGYLNVRGHTPLFLERLNEAIKVSQQAVKTDKDDKAQAEILHHLLSKRGNIYVDRGDLATGLSSYKEALELAPNANREAILLAVIGLTIFRKGDVGSEEYMERAYEVAKKSQDDGTLSYVLNQRGTKAVLTKDFETAKEFLTEAVEIAKRLANAAQLYYALHNLGATQESLGQAQDALATHQEAFKIAEAEENQVWMALASHSIGEDHHALQDREKAQEYLNKARNLHLKSGAVAKVEEITEFMKQHGYSISAE
jgi:tetratricopeptide (TPR) repeat protein